MVPIAQSDKSHLMTVRIDDSRAVYMKGRKNRVGTRAGAIKDARIDDWSEDCDHQQANDDERITLLHDCLSNLG